MRKTRKKQLKTFTSAISTVKLINFGKFPDVSVIVKKSDPIKQNISSLLKKYNYLISQTNKALQYTADRLSILDKQLNKTIDIKLKKLEKKSLPLPISYIRTHNIRLRLGKIITGIILLELLYATYYTLNTNPEARNTWFLATTIQPERFTELYFEDHLNLPKDAIPNKQYNFRFTVHNLEYRDTTYNYETYIDENGKKISIDQGSFTLKQDQFKTIPQTYTITTSLQRSEVVVNLTNKNNQQIDFWISPPSGQNQVASIKNQGKQPTNQKFQYGGWYWQPTLNKAQVWLGKDKEGKNIWSDSFPISNKLITKN